jgi:colicin import membrane protein
MTEVSNRPPKQRGAWLALTLALIMHIALFAFLWIGVRWQNETPLVVEAEIWDPKIREAAPQPQPEPEPPKPVPVPEPVVKPPPPPPKVEEPVVAKPDIALEKEKKRKEQEQKDKEQKEQLAKEKEQQKKLEQQQKDKDQKLAKQKADDEAKKKAEADKLADDKRRKQTDADKKAADQRKADDLQRVRSQAGGTGDAAKSQGPRGSPGYQQKIGAIIKQHTTFRLPDDLVGNPAVEYDVQLLPDGSVNGIRLIKSSNVTGFDDAVKDAINKSSPFPKDTDGTVPSVLHVSHKPKDQ